MVGREVVGEESRGLELRDKEKNKRDNPIFQSISQISKQICFAPKAVCPVITDAGNFDFIFRIMQFLKFD